MLEPAYEEAVNGYILLFLSRAADHTLGDHVLLSMLRRAGFDLNRIELNQQVDFLAGPGNELVAVARRDRNEKWVKLLPKGGHVLAGRIDAMGVMPPYSP